MRTAEQGEAQGSARAFVCARCGAEVLVCSRCDRGQRYCGRACAGPARCESLREAGRVTGKPTVFLTGYRSVL